MWLAPKNSEWPLMAESKHPNALIYWCKFGALNDKYKQQITIKHNYIVKNILLIYLL